LKIDNSSSFSGTVAGQLAISDSIDLADVTAGANATIHYTGNNSPGTLTVSDGTHTANIALLGNYSLASFVASSDGHGGTVVVDPPLTASSPPAGESANGPSADLSTQALLGQYMASAFAPSGFADGDKAMAGLPANAPGYTPLLTDPAGGQLPV